MKIPSKAQIRNSRVALIHINGYFQTWHLRQMADLLETLPEGTTLKMTDGQILPGDFIPELTDRGHFDNRVPEGLVLKRTKESRDLALSRSAQL